MPKLYKGFRERNEIRAKKLKKRTKSAKNENKGRRSDPCFKVVSLFCRSGCCHQDSRQWQSPEATIA